MDECEAVEFLAQLEVQVSNDFGPANRDGHFEPLCAHCQAHHAVRTLIGLYAELELENLEQRVITGRVS